MIPPQTNGLQSNQAQAHQIALIQSSGLGVQMADVFYSV